MTLSNYSSLIYSDAKLDVIIYFLALTIPSTITALAAYYSAKMSADNTYKHNVELNEYRLKYQTYSQLVGQKYLVSQLYILYFLSLIQTLYSQNLIKHIDKIQKADSINYRKNPENKPMIKKSKKNQRAESIEKKRNQIVDENQRASNKTAELAIELAKSNELLWRTIGQINIAFEDYSLISKVEDLKNFEIQIEAFEAILKKECEIEYKKRYDNKTLKEFNYDNLSRWPQEKELQLKNHISTFNEIIESLLNEMNPLLK